MFEKKYFLFKGTKKFYGASILPVQRLPGAYNVAKCS